MEDFAKMVQLLSHENDDFAFVGCFALRKLLSRPRDPPYEQLMASGSAVKLMQLARRVDRPAMQTEALWCLTNVASGDGFVQALLEVEILKLLLEVL